MKKTAPLILPLLVFVFSHVPSDAAEEIGFIEKFALAEDREDALKLLIPGTTITTRSMLTTISKVASDVLVSSLKDVKTQLKSNTIIPARQEYLVKAIYKKPHLLWSHMTSTMKFRTTNPQFPPDDDERHKRVEAILSHPLVREGLKNEKDIRGKLEHNAWVTKEEFNSDWGKALLKKWNTPLVKNK